MTEKAILHDGLSQIAKQQTVSSLDFYEKNLMVAPTITLLPAKFQKQFIPTLQMHFLQYLNKFTTEYKTVAGVDTLSTFSILILTGWQIPSHILINASSTKLLSENNISNY